MGVRVVVLVVFLLVCLQSVKPQEELEQYVATKDTNETGVADLDEVGTVQYAVKDNLAVAQGDIVLGEHRWFIPEPEQVASKKRGNIARSTYGKWPGGHVAYTIDSSYVYPDRIAQAVSHINTKLNGSIKMVPRTNEVNYIIFRASTGCSSAVGMVGGAQSVNLAGGCGVGSIVHEVLHALGVWHEQCRPDRNTYVFVNYTNILDGYAHNFYPLSATEVNTPTPYDYGSIMHYPSWGFAKVSGIPTIVPLQAGVTIGQRSALSAHDITTVVSKYPIGDSAPIASVAPPPPPGRAIPGRVEAENYVNYYDTTTGNSGGKLRTDNVDINSTSIGHFVMNIAAGEWLEYDLLCLATGRYIFYFNVASLNLNTKNNITISIDGKAIGKITIGTVGTTSTFYTFTVVPAANITAGERKVRFTFDTNSLQFNYFSTAMYIPGATIVPGTVYSYAVSKQSGDWYDTTAGNSGGLCVTGVDIDFRKNGSTCYVADTIRGEYMHYILSNTQYGSLKLTLWARNFQTYTSRILWYIMPKDPMYKPQSGFFYIPPNTHSWTAIEAITTQNVPPGELKVRLSPYDSGPEFTRISVTWVKFLTNDELMNGDDYDAAVEAVFEDEAVIGAVTAAAGLTAGIIAAIVVSSVVGAAGIATGTFFVVKKLKQNNKSENQVEMGEAGPAPQKIKPPPPVKGGVNTLNFKRETNEGMVQSITARAPVVHNNN